LTIGQASKKDLLVLVAGIDIHSSLNGKSYKTQAVRVMEFVLSAYLQRIDVSKYNFFERL
jgi:hypothetical protein